MTTYKQLKQFGELCVMKSFQRDAEHFAHQHSDDFRPTKDSECSAFYDEVCENCGADGNVLIEIRRTRSRTGNPTPCQYGEDEWFDEVEE